MEQVLNKTYSGESTELVDLMACNLTLVEGKKRVLSKIKRFPFSIADRDVLPLFSFYYPYYFSEWKVTVPRYVFRDGKALYRVGVNGVTGSASLSDIWPDTQSETVDASRLIRPLAGEKTEEEEARRTLENIVFRTMRPLKPPFYELVRRSLIYMPYHVYAERKYGNIKRLWVMEPFTGVVTLTSRMKEIRSWIEEEAEKCFLSDSKMK
ncbi:MAG: hypothetical protein H0Z33_10260 [Bacillaceae bacterium]|nr:hypothetical protein [Bacillaceae bacterium]